MLAVSTNDNGFKILASTDGMRLLRTVENHTFDSSRVSLAAVVKVLDIFNLSILLSWVHCFKFFILLQVPPIGTFNSANTSTGASFADRPAPVPAMVGIVSVFISGLIVFILLNPKLSCGSIIAIFSSIIYVQDYGFVLFRHLLIIYYFSPVCTDQ